MAGNDALKKLKFESYNGMSRPAMFWNIPIMPMVGLLMGGLVCGIAGTFFLSWKWGLFFTAPFLFSLIAFRFICLIDAQYMRRVLLAYRRLRLNLTYGKPLLQTPLNPQWSAFYGERYAKKRHAPGSESAAAALPRPRTHGDAAR